MRHVSIAILLFAAAVAHAQEDPALWKAYYAGQADSAIYSPAKLRPLKPVVADANGNVLVTNLGESAWPTGLTKKGDVVWVTLVPEVQEKCKQYGADAPMRLRQLLGLPPYSPDGYTIFNVFQVRADSLVRPAPDPATGTTMPCADPSKDLCGNEFPASATPAHISWVANTMLFAYQRPLQFPPSGSQKTVGYPWTHLGYTYDWGSKTSDHYGASEYIIPKGTVIEVVSSADIKTYCK